MNKGPLESEKRRLAARFPFYCYRIPDNASVPTHWHYEIEIFYAEGSGVFHIGGGEYPFEPGDCLFVNSGALHHTVRFSNGGLYHFVVDPSLLRCGGFDCKSNQIVERLIKNELQIQTVVARGSVLHSELLPIMQDLVKYAETAISSGGDQFFITSSLHAVMAILIREKALYPVSKNQDDEANVTNRLITFVKKRYHTNITIDDLAKCANISKSGVYRVFRSSLGTTPVNYINTVRIQQACNLLQEGKNVSETAEAVGMANVTYFVKLFKKEVGQTPLKWLKTNRNK